MTHRQIFTAGLTLFLMSGCAPSLRERALVLGKVCADTPDRSAANFVKSVPLVIFDVFGEGWKLMVSAIAPSLHPLEVFGGPGEKARGLKKVLELIRPPSDDDYPPGAEVDNSLHLVRLEGSFLGNARTALLEARQNVVLPSGEKLPEKIWRRRFRVYFQFPGNCIYHIEELDNKWTRVK